MRTIRRNLRKSAVALAISMSALPNLVNAQAPSLTSVNKDKASKKTELRDSVKDDKSGVSKLMAAVLKTGGDGIVGALAPVVGLEKDLPLKGLEIVTSQKETDIEKRACYVIYENTESTETEGAVKRPVCAYIVKIKRSGLDKQMRFFRIGLDGKLEKVVLTESKFDENGKGIRGSGVKFDQDIDSPEVKKTFAVEMKFWLKDWLKKEQKAAAKTSASVAAPASTKTPL